MRFASPRHSRNSRHSQRWSWGNPPSVNTSLSECTEALVETDALSVKARRHRTRRHDRQDRSSGTYVQNTVRKIITYAVRDEECDATSESIQYTLLLQARLCRGGRGAGSGSRSRGGSGPSFLLCLLRRHSVGPSCEVAAEVSQRHRHVGEAGRGGGNI